MGTTGGGVWVAQNAATSSTANISFVPLTDNLGRDGNGVRAPPSAWRPVDSAGRHRRDPGRNRRSERRPRFILRRRHLRSADSGRTWSLIPYATLSNHSFLGEGFAGFAWSTKDQQLVVAAVSQAYEGMIVGARAVARSYEGLYYSTDSGATWSLAQITDANGLDVQGPLDAFTLSRRETSYFGRMEPRAQTIHRGGALSPATTSRPTVHTGRAWPPSLAPASPPP